ncbi:IS5 family transposase [Rubidibacter lacunae]|uniref:IS5 family transposase n=1 Tax=Rubidibacter lacunae TaxID=582514 RepID=UPI00267E77A4
MGEKGLGIGSNAKPSWQNRSTCSCRSRGLPWDSFRPTLNQIHEKERKSNAGRKPWDVVLMFKLLILQQLYNSSDDELEHQVTDRLSFVRFTGLGIEDAVPDAKTVWLFREQLKERELTEELFPQFGVYLRQAGYQARGSQMVDATLVPVPSSTTAVKRTRQSSGERHRRSGSSSLRSERRKTARHDGPRSTAALLRLQVHVGVDREYKLICTYTVTNASGHDSQALESYETEGTWETSFGETARIAVSSRNRYWQRWE